MFSEINTNQFMYGFLLFNIILIIKSLPRDNTYIGHNQPVINFALMFKIEFHGVLLLKPFIE